MSKIRERERNSILNAITGGVTPRQGIQHIQVGRYHETEAILKDIENIKDGSAAVRIIQGSYGSGKKIPLDAPVLSKNGWVMNGDLKTGDEIYTRKGTLARVKGISETTDEKIVSMVLADGRELKSCINHQWIVLKENNGHQEETVMTSEEIIAAFPSQKMSIPSISPIDYPKKDLILPPYMLGTFFSDLNNASLPATLSADLVYVSEKICESLSEMGLNPLEPIGRSIVGYASYEQDDELVDKQLKECLRGNIDQRTNLLHGIMDVAGIEDKSAEFGDFHFESDCFWFARFLLNLVRSLGYVGKVSHNRVSFYSVSSQYPFSKPASNVPSHQNGVLIEDIRLTEDTVPMRCIAVDDDSHSYIIDGYTVTHNTFFLTLVKTVALKQNMMTMSADFSPDRRLYSSSGQANALYRELVRNLSSSIHPDGGALEELLNAIDEKTSLGDSEFLATVRRLPYGYDAVSVIGKWHQACHPSTDKEQRDSFIMKDACLRWFAGENTIEHKKLLGVKSSIGDDGAYDALKMIAMLCHSAGYSGLMVELDECVNLFKINNSTSRDRNYEQILRIFNECLQGDAKYIGFIFGGTPEFVMDPRRGLFSYDALRSRLISNDYKASEETDTTGPTIDLAPLSQEDLLVLLGNLTNVEALGERENWLLSDDEMRRFLKKHFEALGANYYRTPREIIRSYIGLLRTIKDNPEWDVEKALGTVEIKQEQKQSGLGAALTQKDPKKEAVQEEDDDADFGF